MEIVILGVLGFLLGIIYIFQEEIKAKLKEKPHIDEKEEQRKKDVKEQFDKLMNYSYDDVIKRGDN